MWINANFNQKMNKTYGQKTIFPVRFNVSDL